MTYFAKFGSLRSTGRIFHVSIILFGFLSFDLEGKTKRPIFEDPFDIGAGGNTLTRATQEGILVSNPALLPYGGKILRWLGVKTTISAGKDSINYAREIANLSPKGGLAEGGVKEFVRSLFQKPIHVGYAQSLSFLTNHFGFALFTSIEPDVQAWRYGDFEKGAGTPMVLFRSEAYAGAYLSGATRLLTDWFSIGASLKYLAVDERELRVEITDTEAILNIQKQLTASAGTGLTVGAGLDLGALIFLQGRFVDFNIGYSIKNFGTTVLKGPSGDELSLKETSDLGLSVALHTNKDVIHLGADYRDIKNAYEEPQYKKVSFGARYLFRGIVGFSAGIYHGFPSYGFELDLFVLRLALASYRREFGDRPGVDSRDQYMVSIIAGTSF